MQTHDLCGIISSIIESENSFSLAVFPNPTAGEFKLVLSDNDLAKNAQVLIYNVLGELVYENSFLFGQNQDGVDLNLSHESKGVYFLRVKSEGNMVCKKIVVQ